MLCGYGALAGGFCGAIVDIVRGVSYASCNVAGTPSLGARVAWSSLWGTLVMGAVGMLFRAKAHEVRNFMCVGAVGGAAAGLIEGSLFSYKF